MRQLMENFCLEIVQSGNGTEAYKKEGYKVKLDNAAVVGAAKLLRKDKVQKIMDAAERRELLTQFARDEETVKPDRLKAMDLLNKMDGVYINKTQVSGADGAPLVFRWEGKDG